MSDTLTKESKPVLRHQWLGSAEAFFQEIDRCGGWPHNGAAVVMRHDEGRTCYFVTKPTHNDGWNTTIATADEYYLWKLSPKAKEKLLSDLRIDLNRKLLTYLSQP